MRPAENFAFDTKRQRFDECGRNHAADYTTFLLAVGKPPDFAADRLC